MHPRRPDRNAQGHPSQTWMTDGGKQPDLHIGFNSGEHFIAKTPGTLSSQLHSVSSSLLGHSQKVFFPAVGLDRPMMTQKMGQLRGSTSPCLSPSISFDMMIIPINSPRPFIFIRLCILLAMRKTKISTGVSLGRTGWSSGSIGGDIIRSMCNRVRWITSCTEKSDRERKMNQY